MNASTSIALRDESGFTIQEILVAIIVGSVLVSLGLSFFLFFSKFSTTVERKREVETAANSALQQIAIDIQRAREVIQCEDTVIVLGMSAAKSVAYAQVGDEILRNGTVIGTVLMHMHATRSALDSTFIDIAVRAEARGYGFAASTTVRYARSSRDEFLRARAYAR